MFFTYVARELRRRRRQAVVVALGLALGVGLVVTVSAMAAGVRDAQGSVLQSLYGVGTDVTVTDPAERGSGPSVRFGLNPGDEEQPGEEFSRDDVLPSPGLGALDSDQVAKVAAVNGVRAAAGGLSLMSIHLEGTFAEPIPVGGEGGGFVGPAPDEVRASVAPVDVNTYSITGVDVTAHDVGPVTGAEITGGRFFRAADADAAVAVVDEGYAQQEELEVGETLAIDGTAYEVIGIATSPTGTGASNVYIPLARAQELAGMEGKVNRIYVKADSASSIPAVESAIQAELPEATVTSSEDLASQVTGSLSSASKLSGTLGTWLSWSALIAAFSVASLLTMSAVGRRVREFGTLKALGWRSRRVVGQVMGEAVVQGILGGVLGIGLGLGGAALVSRFFPSLQASLGPGSPGGRLLEPDDVLQGVTVPLDASVSVPLMALAVGLALLGGIVAGSLGGWRAARLRPADALRRVE